MRMLLATGAMFFGLVANANAGCVTPTKLKETLIFTHHALSNMSSVTWFKKLTKEEKENLVLTTTFLALEGQTDTICTKVYKLEYSYAVMAAQETYK